MILFLLYCNIEALYALFLCIYYGSFSMAFLRYYSWVQRIAAYLLALDGLLTISFTGEMMRRQVLSIITGIGTIDRLKLAKGKQIAGGDPLPLASIFGIDFPLLWLFPIDPFFDNPDDILGYRRPPSSAAESLSKDQGEITSVQTPLLATGINEDSI